MCFNASVSFLTFLIGLAGSYALMKFGNKKYYKDNIVFGIFFIFIALIQLMDYFFWIDLKNKLGINHLVTLLGPLLNVGQPLILYLVKCFYFKPEMNLSIMNTNTFFEIVNICYFIYLVGMYSNFIQDKAGKLVTSTSHGHLSWPWIAYSNPWYYLIVLAINIFYLTNFTYSLVGFLIVYFFLLVSYYFFYYNIGELWCFFGAFTPYLMIIASYLL